MVILEGREVETGAWGHTHARVDVFWIEVSRALAKLRGTSNKHELQALLVGGLGGLSPSVYDNVVAAAERRCDARTDADWRGRAELDGEVQL